MHQVTEHAVMGLMRQGYDAKHARGAIGKRLSDLRGRGPSSVVKPALDDVAMGLPPVRRRRADRHAVIPGQGDTPVTLTHAVTQTD